MKRIKILAHSAKWIAIIILSLLLSMLIIGLAGCSVLKTKQVAVKDSVAVQKTDSGQVKKTEVTENKESTWFREIFMKLDSNQRTPADINIPASENHYITQPTVYIREGGTMQENRQVNTVDSGWYRQLDSVKALISVTNTSKEKQVFNMWWLVAIAAVGILVGWGGSKFKIVKAS